MITEKIIRTITPTECEGLIRPIHGDLEVLSDKLKLPILISLSFGAKRLKQISKDVSGITDKVHSKELKDLKMNLLINSRVFDTFPPTVKYIVTERGLSFFSVFYELSDWGKHREKISSKYN